MLPSVTKLLMAKYDNLNPKNMRTWKNIQVHRSLQYKSKYI